MAKNTAKKGSSKAKPAPKGKQAAKADPKKGKKTKPAAKPAAKKPAAKAKPAPKGKPAKAKAKPAKAKTTTIRAQIEFELPANKNTNALLSKAAFGKNFALLIGATAATKLGLDAKSRVVELTAVRGAAPGSDEEE